MARPRKKKEAPKRKKAKTKAKAEPKRVKKKPTPSRAPAKKTTPKKIAPKKTTPTPKKVVAPPKGWVQKFIEKPTTTPEQRAAAKKSLERPPPTPKLKRDKRGRVRDYKAEYQRRIQRGEVLQRATTDQPSKAVSRGHPRRKKGEIGLDELRQLRKAVKLPSPGEQRRSGVKEPVQYEERVIARAFIAEIAGIPADPVTSTKATRRSPEAERFAEIFVAMGLGSLIDAYTLYFSP